MGIHFRLLAVAAITLSLLACGNNSNDAVSKKDNAPLLTAAILGPQTVLSVQEYRAQARYANANLKNGAMQARRCHACHSLDKGGPNMAGPALYGFFGTRVGSRDRYHYSPVMRNADFVWTPRALDGWLTQPYRFLPGNRMQFAGVMKQSNRDDLVAYLLQVTAVLDNDEDMQD